MKEKLVQTTALLFECTTLAACGQDKKETRFATAYKEIRYWLA